MKLSELLKNIKPTAIVGDSEREVTGIEIDSRKFAAGGLFVAMKGTQVDGHRFIEKAIEQGAVAVLCEDLPEKMPSDVTFVQVESTEEAVGPVATVFFGEPSLRLKEQTSVLLLSRLRRALQNRMPRLPELHMRAARRLS